MYNILLYLPIRKITLYKPINAILRYRFALIMLKRNN